MKVLLFMETKHNYLILMFFCLILGSCTSNKCDCEKYRHSMAKVTISVKSLNEDDIEIKCVGRYCCSRVKYDNNWTIIQKNHAELISNYNRIENPNTNYSKKTDSLYNLGFVGLSFDILNIKNISYIDRLDLIIDSLNNLPDRQINSIFFDNYPNSISIEFKDLNGSLLNSMQKMSIQH